MRPTASLLSAALLLVTVGCGSDTTTAPEPRPIAAAQRVGPGSVAVPFRATLEGSGALPTDPTRCGALLTIGLQSTGTGTHLGRLSGVHSHCLDPQSPLSYTGGLVTFTAADGDQLFATYGGVLIPLGGGVFAFGRADGGQVVPGNPIEFTGGTGRFAGATGAAIGTGTVDLSGPVPVFAMTIDGTLVLPR